MRGKIENFNRLYGIRPVIQLFLIYLSAQVCPIGSTAVLVSAFIAYQRMDDIGEFGGRGKERKPDKLPRSSNAGLPHFTTLLYIIVIINNA